MFGARARAAGLLYAGSAGAGCVLAVLVWQTPVGQAIEEITGFRPALIGSAIGSLATGLLPERPNAIIALPPPPSAPTAVPVAPSAVPAIVTAPSAVPSVAPAVGPATQEAAVTPPGGT